MINMYGIYTEHIALALSCEYKYEYSTVPVYLYL